MMDVKKEWFSAVDLAGLPKMPSTRYGVTKKAKREGWRSRKRQGRGGGLEYHILSLPPAARDWLNLANPESPDELRAKAKLRIVDHWHRFVLMSKFCEAYNDGYLFPGEWVKEAIPSISEADLLEFIWFYMIAPTPDKKEGDYAKSKIYRV